MKTHHWLLVDDIIVPTIHFTKDSGEHSSVTLDENSRLEILTEQETEPPAGKS